MNPADFERSELSQCPPELASMLSPSDSDEAALYAATRSPYAEPEQVSKSVDWMRVDWRKPDWLLARIHARHPGYVRQMRAKWGRG